MYWITTCYICICPCYQLHQVSEIIFYDWGLPSFKCFIRMIYCVLLGLIQPLWSLRMAFLKRDIGIIKEILLFSFLLLTKKHSPIRRYEFANVFFPPEKSFPSTLSHAQVVKCKDYHLLPGARKHIRLWEILWRYTTQT